MLFRMLRTQTSEHATFRMGVAYDAGKNPTHIKAAKAFIDAGLAEEVTAKQLDAEKTKAEKLAAPSVKSKKDGGTVAAITAAQEAEAKAKQEADAARSAEAAALKEAEEARLLADDLAKRVADLETQLAQEDQQKNAK